MLLILFGALTFLFAGALRRRHALAIGALLLAFVLLIPAGVGAEAPPDMMVYDYTTTNSSYWTPIIISTVDEFNAVRPATAPRLVYSAESGTFDCLDLPPQVANLAGIIICDTTRSGEFPYDPNAPKEGWAGVTHQVDNDTMRIALNSYVPDGFYLTAEDVDNTVCHEMMHAYTLVPDNYDSDVHSCVFGDLLSPGTTDVGLMKGRWPATVSVPEPSRRVPVTAPDSTALEWIIIVAAILVPLVWAFTHHGITRILTLMLTVPFWLFVMRVVYWTPDPTAPLDLRMKWAVDLGTDPLTIAWPVFVLLTFGLIKLFIRFHRGLLVWGALIIAGVFALNHFSRGAAPMLREFDAASAMLSIQTTLAGYGDRISATGPPEHRATAASAPRPTPIPTSTKVTGAPTAESPNGTRGGVHPTANDPEDAKTTAPTAAPRATAPTVPPPTPTPISTNVTAAPTAESPNETGDDDPPAANVPAVATTDEPTDVPEDALDAAAAPAANAPDRRQCDPAYPDERTCIPPGPPLDEPCAITNERNFTVLPPDPRALDTDGDGIGCEPIPT